MDDLHLVLRELPRALMLFDQTPEVYNSNSRIISQADMRLVDLAISLRTFLNGHALTLRGILTAPARARQNTFTSHFTYTSI